MEKIHCNSIGELRQDTEFADWWESDPIPIPFFDEKLTVTFRGFRPDVDASFISEADLACKNFLLKGAKDRLDLTNEIYQNFQEFLDDVGVEYLGDEMHNLTSKEEIWRFVYPSQIFVTRRNRRDRDIYVQVTCECYWEPEHGLQLVFRQGKKLTRVSGQDGHLTEAEAYDIKDSDDRLLSQF